MEIDEFSKEQIEIMAKHIREKSLGGKIFGVWIDEFTLKHPDIALVCAYYLGTTDNTIQWKKVINDFKELI